MNCLTVQVLVLALRDKPTRRHTTVRRYDRTSFDLYSYVAKVRKDASMQEGRIVECTFEILDPVPLIRKIEPIPDHGIVAF